jgi:hypothetical protein
MRMNFNSRVKKHHPKTFRLVLSIALLGAVVWAAVYGYEHGLTSKWKQMIIAELEKNGVRATIGRLTVDPFNGLTARDVEMYDLTQGGQHLADISHISLDVDLGKIIRGEDFLRTIDLRNAALSLPVDPEKPDAERLEIRDLNARILLEGDRLDVTKAQGVIAGVRVNLSGSVDLPRTTANTPEEMERLKAERRRRLLEIRQRRTALRQAIQVLDKFRAPGPDKASVTISVNGPLSDFNALQADVTVEAGNLRCGEFEAKSLKGEAVLSDGKIALRSLQIEDQHGTLSLQAAWEPSQTNAVDFWLDSSVDLHALLKGLWPERALGEVVFYHPPHIRADGKVFLNEPWSADGAPVDMVSRVDCRRFTTHGVIFDGFHGDFRLRRGEFFARDVKLDHHSGSAGGYFLYTKEGGMRCALEWNMELNAALPFLASEEARQWIADFEFTQESLVRLRAAGAGPSLDPSTWTGSVQADVRNFAHRDLTIRSAGAEVTLAGGKAVLRGVRVQRPDGEITARQIVAAPDGPLTISGLVSTTMPHPVLRSLGRSLYEEVRDYTFTKPPRVEVDALIFPDNPSQTEYTIHVTSDGPGTILLSGEKLNLAAVDGTLRRQNDVLHLDFTGKGAEGLRYSSLTFNDEPAVRFTGRLGVGVRRGKLRSYLIGVEAASGVLVDFAGKQLPSQNFSGRVSIEGASATVNATARVVGGATTATVEIPDIAAAPADAIYQASVRVEKIDYARLAKIFDPAKEAVGTISGHLNFTGKPGESGSIKGSGRLQLLDGAVFAIPWLGPLSQLVTAVLPVGSLAYSVAREANASVTVENGLVATKDLEAQTRTFRLKVEGVVDYVRDRVDLTARLNARGAPGLLLYPVSKLFEYEAQGNLADPGWKPKHLGIPFLGGGGSDDPPKPPPNTGAGSDGDSPAPPPKRR